jgi:hypothetical protein
MSIGGDLVGEVVALLQPLHSETQAVVREYGGELDDMDKDTYTLPTTLYMGSLAPISTVLVEFNGVEHEPRDSSNVLYLNTYKVNVWVVAGYKYSVVHKEGGAALALDVGYALYDGVLDLVAGRRLLKGAETVRLVRGERVYFGNEKSGPPGGENTFEPNEKSAVVYKMEFTVKAQSVWEQFPGEAPVRAPG